jgi:hypothetical protein
MHAGGNSGAKDPLGVSAIYQMRRSGLVHSSVHHLTLLLVHLDFCSLSASPHPPGKSRCEFVRGSEQAGRRGKFVGAAQPV